MALKSKTPMVIDADGLFTLAQHPALLAAPTAVSLSESDDPDSVEDEANVIITPNVVEFKRLRDSLAHAALLRAPVGDTACASGDSENDMAALQLSERYEYTC